MKQVVVDVPGLAEKSTDLKPAGVKKIIDAAGGAARILEEQQILPRGAAKSTA